MPIRRPGKAAVVLVIDLFAVSWSLALWAADTAPWWAPVAIGVATSLHMIVSHYLDKKKNVSRRRLAVAERERRAAATAAKAEAGRRADAERRVRDSVERADVEHRVAARAMDEARRERERATAAEIRARQAEQDAADIIDSLMRAGIRPGGRGHEDGGREASGGHKAGGGHEASGGHAGDGERADGDEPMMGDSYD